MGTPTGRSRTAWRNLPSKRRLGVLDAGIVAVACGLEAHGSATPGTQRNPVAVPSANSADAASWMIGSGIGSRPSSTGCGSRPPLPLPSLLRRHPPPSAPRWRDVRLGEQRRERASPRSCGVTPGDFRYQPLHRSGEPQHHDPGEKHAQCRDPRSADRDRVAPRRRGTDRRAACVRHPQRRPQQTRPQWRELAERHKKAARANAV